MAAVGDAATPRETLFAIVSGKMPIWFYTLLLIGPALAFLRPWYVGYLAGVLYHRNAMADKPLRFSFKSDAVE